MKATAPADLTDGEVEALGGSGFIIREGFVDEPLGQALRLLAARRLNEAQLKPAGIGRGADKQRDETVRSDLTAWLERDDADPAVRAVWNHFEALRVTLNERAWLGLRQFELQLACYPGGGTKYAPHRDAFTGDDNRRVTAIAYLNSDWKPADGGVLRLRTVLPVDVEPRLGRAVIFLSQKVEHEVLPAWATRFAITAWYSAQLA